MNTQEMLRLIDSISRDRNVDKESLYTDIEQAMVSAARKHFNAVDTEEFTCELDRVTGGLSIRRGDEPITLESLGRIPAQTAKQVIIQRFREDERSSIYNEFIERVGELVTGMAQRYEGGALVVTISRAEGFMPRSEQIAGEQHQPGERVRCLILDVRKADNQVKIVLSRGHADFIRRLFEVEVPEVAERIIEIKGMAREPGYRTKVAVSSIDSRVDAVGACVGVRGSRIKNIVDELGGEKIDIVRWNESSQILIQNSLKPAEVVETSLCFELGRATVVVNEDQLSLAIGKRGQNVRLAARLTNWDIDILTPAEFTKSLDIMEECLKGIEGISEEQIDRLAALGIISVFDVEEVGAAYFVESIECMQEQAEQMIQAAAERAKVVAEEQLREKQEAAQRKEQDQAVLAASPGEAQAAAVLGDLLPAGGGAPADGDAQGTTPPTADSESGSIIEMLETRHAQTQQESDASSSETDAEPSSASESASESESESEPEPASESEPESAAETLSEPPPESEIEASQKPTASDESTDDADQISDPVDQADAQQNRGATAGA